MKTTSNPNHQCSVWKFFSFDKKYIMQIWFFIGAIMCRNSFETVVPVYHMNKYHWNSIILDGTYQ